MASIQASRSLIFWVTTGILTIQDFFLVWDADWVIVDTDFVLGQYFCDSAIRCRQIVENGEIVILQGQALQEELNWCWPLDELYYPKGPLALGLGEQPTVELLLHLGSGPWQQIRRPTQAREQKLSAGVRPLKIPSAYLPMMGEQPFYSWRMENRVRKHWCDSRTAKYGRKSRRYRSNNRKMTYGEQSVIIGDVKEKESHEDSPLRNGLCDNLIFILMKLSTSLIGEKENHLKCENCQTVLCQPTGGCARLTEGCSFRRKGHQSSR
ncbi:hypothetical protein Acr_00g0049680 [Actinidia rufa]|uniref:Uncharacterized protein n=1 Tax=Actinidia rufa TaxID=165716 RepID=A0A7J0DKZ3_9ERIC|nr:hypothetical protein Acr_00g0049680 [Actinidia rufa]